VTVPLIEGERKRMRSGSRTNYLPRFVFLLTKVCPKVFLQSDDKIPSTINLIFHCQGFKNEEKKEEIS
jgi:hypothetical protein